MKLAVFTNNNPNQKALVNKICKVLSVDAVIVSRNVTTGSNKTNKKPFLLKVMRFVFSFPFSSSWKKLNKKYNLAYLQFPCTPLHVVDNINDEKVINYIINSKPNLILVSGTTMVKNCIIEAASKINCTILNLHTGISPYVKGGPNCTNWCLAKNSPHLIGNTIMKLDIGIDSGDIVATERTSLNGDESLYELHMKVMEHAHDLYVRSVLQIIRNGKINAVNQNSVALGDLFLSRDWTIFQIVKAYSNFILFYKKRVNKTELLNNVKLFPIENCVTDI